MPSLVVFCSVVRVSSVVVHILVVRFSTFPDGLTYHFVDTDDNHISDLIDKIYQVGSSRLPVRTFSSKRSSPDYWTQLAVNVVCLGSFPRYTYNHKGASYPGDFDLAWINVKSSLVKRSLVFGFGTGLSVDVQRKSLSR